MEGGKYQHLTPDELVRLLVARDRRDATRFGLVWEANEIERDKAINADFVALDLAPELSTPQPEGGWNNLIIEGDNFDALRYLRMTHSGKVKCILIDPPYNTGSKDFVYNDSFMDANDSWRFSTWIEFLYQRLIIARDLLRDDGVMLVCINDENRSKLELLLDKIMPGRRVGSFVWRTRSGARVSKNHFVSVDQEYVLCYANKKFAFAGSTKSFADYANPDNDPLGDWANFNLTKGQSYKERPRSYYPLQNPETGVWYACNPDRVWAFSSETKIKKGQRLQGKSMEQVIKEKKVLWPKDDKVVTFQSMDDLMSAIDAGTAPRHVRRGLPDLEFWIGKPIGFGMPRYKMHKSELDTGNNPLSTWISAPDSDEAKALMDAPVETMQSGFTAEAATLLTSMLGTKDFSYAKPLSLVQSLIQQCTTGNDLIVDFFAGSGTTAHAVLAQNGDDDQVRRFILVSSTEATEKEPDTNICRDVCQRRIAAAINGYSFAAKQGLRTISGLGGDFAYLRCKRIPAGQLLEIDHEQVWTALQMIHLETLMAPERSAGTPARLEKNIGAAATSKEADKSVRAPLLCAGDEMARLIYVPRFSKTLLPALRESVKDCAAAVIYSWQPETLRLHIRAGNVQHEAIPESLARRFGLNA